MTNPILLLFAAPNAQAFCGTYVGAADVTNEASHLVVTRQDSTTTLTMSNDFQGAPETFGLIVPVPRGVGPDDVGVVAQSTLEELETYTAPRMVSYTCDDVQWVWIEGEGWSGDVDTSSSASSGCGSGTSSGSGSSYVGGTSEAELSDGDVAVGVTSRFVVGGYDVAVIEPDTWDDVDGWLAANGFEISEQAGALLDEYIGGGSALLAVRIAPDEVADTADTGAALDTGQGDSGTSGSAGETEDTTPTDTGLTADTGFAESVEPMEDGWLPPLQVIYDSDVVSLPLRLGTTSSAGEQDLIVHVLGDLDDGAWLSSTHVGADVGDIDCMLEGDFSKSYDERLDAALQPGAGEVSVVFEYGWGSGKCDPCPPGFSYLSSDVASELGFDGYTDDLYVTRLHLRYTPDDLEQDLVLYPTGIDTPWQVRYIQYTEELGSFFRICDGGMGIGDCDQPDEPPSGGDESYEETDGDSALCSAVGLTPFCLSLWILARRQHQLMHTPAPRNRA